MNKKILLIGTGGTIFARCTICAVFTRLTVSAIKLSTCFCLCQRFVCSLL